MKPQQASYNEVSARGLFVVHLIRMFSAFAERLMEQLAKLISAYR
jgi:hypothetical protein